MSWKQGTENRAQKTGHRKQGTEKNDRTSANIRGKNQKSRTHNISKSPQKTNMGKNIFELECNCWLTIQKVSPPYCTVYNLYMFPEVGLCCESRDSIYSIYNISMKGLEEPQEMINQAFHNRYFCTATCFFYIFGVQFVKKIVFKHV